MPGRESFRNRRVVELVGWRDGCRRLLTERLHGGSRFKNRKTIGKVGTRFAGASTPHQSRRQLYPLCRLLGLLGWIRSPFTSDGCGTNRKRREVLLKIPGKVPLSTRFDNFADLLAEEGHLTRAGMITKPGKLGGPRGNRRT